MEFIDNHPVVAHRVRFTDRAEVSEPDAEHVKDGETVVWIVQAVCQPPSYHPTGKESPDRFRFNIQKVQRASVLTGRLREGALHYLDDPTQQQGYMVFDAPVFPDEPELPLYAVPDAVPDDAPAADLDLLGDDIQIVGMVYGNHESETYRMLREASWD